MANKQITFTKVVNYGYMSASVSCTTDGEFLWDTQDPMDKIALPQKVSGRVIRQMIEEFLDRLVDAEVSKSLNAGMVSCY